MKPLIIANWKCNPVGLEEAERLFNSVEKGIKNVKNTEVVICPPFVYLPILSSLIGHQPSVKLGAQDCFWEEKGAFTGEISPLMLKNLGCQYVIIGHSERRKYQQERDSMIYKKIEAVFKIGLKPILCIDRISQIKKDLKGIENLIVAYEPLFAIGTGKPCSTEKAKRMRMAIKEKLNKNIPILYGGSVNSENARDYVERAGFQGLLVGGASLNAQEFIALVKNVSRG